MKFDTRKGACSPVGKRDQVDIVGLLIGNNRIFYVCTPMSQDSCLNCNYNNLKTVKQYNIVDITIFLSHEQNVPCM